MRRLSVAVLFIVLTACQSGSPAGIACTATSSCASPLVCRFGRCRTECSANRDCPLGAQCYLDASGAGACQLQVDRSCGSESCGGGLVCLGSTCVRACTMPSDCPVDGMCSLASGETVGICTDPRGALDAGVPGDAGAACTPFADAQHVCVGSEFACAIRTDTSVACWGFALGGEVGSVPDTRCGDASAAPCAMTPVAVPLGEGGMLMHAAEIACGASFACARLDDGHVRCWGRNYAGQLGVVSDGVRGAQQVVDDVGVAITGATSLGVGYAHACVLRGPSSAYCWGRNLEAQLGLGMVSDHEAAGAAPQLETVAPMRGLWAMGASTCVLDDTNVLHCVGDNAHAELGVTAATANPSTTLRPLGALSLGMPAVISTSTGGGCALDASSHAQCWGWNVTLGRMTVPPDDQPDPGPIYGPAAALAFGSLFGGSTRLTNCGIVGGDTYCWGENSFSTAAVDPTVTTQALPTRVAGLPAALEGACSETNCCAVDTNHQLWCWGGNPSGALGRGSYGPDDFHPGTVCAPHP